MGKSKEKDRHQGRPIVFRCSPADEELILKMAASLKVSKSEAMRQIFDAGMTAMGYKQDEDHLLQLIQFAVKATFQPQVERLAAISAKAAQISGATFFMNLFTSRLLLPPAEQQLVEETAIKSRKLGVEYLKLKDRDVDSFIETGVEKILDN